MSQQEKLQMAKAYIDQQLAAMTAHGAAKKLSQHQYEAMVKQAAGTILR